MRYMDFLVPLAITFIVVWVGVLIVDQMQTQSAQCPDCTMLMSNGVVTFGPNNIPSYFGTCGSYTRNDPLARFMGQHVCVRGTRA
jgi:hypothetical protein